MGKVVGGDENESKSTSKDKGYFQVLEMSVSNVGLRSVGREAAKKANVNKPALG